MALKDIKKNGMSALEKYWGDEKLMAKISKASSQEYPTEGLGFGV